MLNARTNDNRDSLDVAEVVNEYVSARRRVIAFQRFAIGMLCVMGIPFLAAILYEVVTGSRPPDNVQNYLTPFMIVPALSIPLLIGMVPALKKKQKAVLKLTQSHDVSALGPLVERIGSGDIYLRDHVALAIMHLVPMLDESNKDVLLPNHWKLLCKTLDADLLITFSASQLNVDYFVAVLDCMATIGDTSTLKAVERLAVITPKNTGQARVKQHADELLLKMRERLERQSAVDSLLRPVGDGGHALLRPVQAHGVESEDKNLLRPIN